MIYRRPAPRVLVPLALLALAPVLIAGDLNPPPGPVAPTMKTLDQVEPRIAINATNTPGNSATLYRITQPGSYYLTGNITGVAGKHGIEIASHGVTIDLCGFALSGIPGSTLNGIHTTSLFLKNIAIKNGIIRYWGGHGIDLLTAPAFSIHISDLRVEANAGSGIMTRDGVVQGCISNSNGGDGIMAAFGVVVSNCTTNENGGHGINATQHCNVVDCNTSVNAGSGVFADNGCSIRGVTASLNTVDGITAGQSCTIIDCLANQNTRHGIQINDACLVVNNQATSNGYLAGVGANFRVINNANRLENNYSQAAEHGFHVDGFRNLLRGNQSDGCTVNYQVPGTNHCLVVQLVFGTAINGNSGGTSIGTTDPHANFAR